MITYPNQCGPAELGARLRVGHRVVAAWQHDQALTRELETLIEMNPHADADH